ncbi:NAD(P)-linked oxidoreductase superfamily protein [Actinidia rufa]|uniref:NAD(P)-linked oxidoreductase superfamily protein n=1 Tax=Actinidia rufa TaxID=165716 RepID=A0A7J0HDW8_9ERIC|nr:NAD(P)-linked oxidoreductase superfamily protein [Actinidia rufa]
MKSIPEASLSCTDKTIPLVGFGTAVYPLQPSQTMRENQSSGRYNSATATLTRLPLVQCAAHHDLVLPALQNSLNSTPGKYEVPIKEEDIVPFDLKSVWEAMEEECKNVGLTKSIGVSNFSCKKLQQLLATANIPPAVNQVEMNPLWQQKKLREFCERNGIHVTAYSPLGAKGTIWGSSQVMECDVLNDIAIAREKTVAQVGPINQI